MEKIRSFRGDYAFLSNFYPAPIAYKDWTFPTAENLYQAAKSTKTIDWFNIQAMTPGQAKRAGRKLEIREDWDQVKLEIMTEIVTLKFQQHPELMAKLIATESREIIEENYWGDTYWGVYAGMGENHLGKIIMSIRDNKTT